MGQAVTSERSARLNMRLSPTALDTLRRAASAQQQDVTSFVLGAAMERARWTLMEVQALRLTPAEWEQVAELLDEEPRPVPELVELLRWARDREVPDLSTPDRPVYRRSGRPD